MKYLVIPFILAASYYTVTYGVAVWSREKNRTGGAAVILLALAGAVFPIALLFVEL